MSLKPKTQITVQLAKGRVGRITARLKKASAGLIQAILHEVLINVKKDLRDWIRLYVPRRTGQLQHNLLFNLDKSRITRGILKFIAGSTVRYADRVDRMSSGQVKHHGWREHSGKRAYAYYYGHRGRIFLNDPAAVGGFFEKLLDYMRRRVDYHITIALRRYIGAASAQQVGLKIKSR